MIQHLAAIDILTPPGRGAVAVIRCAGNVAMLDGDASFAALCKARDDQPFAGRTINRITFARWGTAHPEDVVICRTSETEFEIHCHGGPAAVERIRFDLAQQAGRGWTELSEGSPGAGGQGDLIAAAWEAVSRATTLRTADLLLHQAAVAWPALFENAQGADAPRSSESIGEALRWAKFGRHLTEPWEVALCGAPNAGKSSLMNALAGFQRSIVNQTPGTTRDAVTLDVAFDGWPVRLIDTAGLRESDDDLEAAGIERARRVIAEADLVLHVFDVMNGPPPSMEGAIPLANKIDLLPDDRSLFADAINVSALTGAGIETLIRRIVGRLVPELPFAGLAVPVCPPHLVFLESAALDLD